MSASKVVQFIKLQQKVNYQIDTYGRADDESVTELLAITDSMNDDEIYMAIELQADMAEADMW